MPRAELLNDEDTANFVAAELLNDEDTLSVASFSVASSVTSSGPVVKVHFLGDFRDYRDKKLQPSPKEKDEQKHPAQE